MFTYHPGCEESFFPNILNCRTPCLFYSAAATQPYPRDHSRFLSFRFVCAFEWTNDNEFFPKMAAFSFSRHRKLYIFYFWYWVLSTRILMLFTLQSSRSIQLKIPRSTPAHEINAWLKYSKLMRHGQNLQLTTSQPVKWSIGRCIFMPATRNVERKNPNRRVYLITSII